MTKIAIIGANEFQDPLIREANHRGYETHVFAWKAGDIGERTAQYFYPISITEKETILEQCQAIGIDAICSIGSDLAAIAVNYIANRMNLPSNPPETALIATNKYEMRKAFQRAKLSSPEFYKADSKFCLEEAADLLSRMKLPLIVKPTDRSGSRGIQKLDIMDPQTLLRAVRNACSQSFEHAAIIETFLEGEEYSCECMTNHGCHTLLAITKKFTTGAPHYIETGHLQPIYFPTEIFSRIKSTVFSGLDALHITCGASHSEFKIDSKGSIHLIEIGARMGGDCIGSDLVPLSTGIDFVGQVLDTALGLPPSMMIHTSPCNVAIRFIFSQNDLDHMNMLFRQSPELFHRIGEIHTPTNNMVTDSSTRFGFYILKSPNQDSLIQLAQLKTCL